MSLISVNHQMESKLVALRAELRRIRRTWTERSNAHRPCAFAKQSAATGQKMNVGCSNNSSRSPTHYPPHCTRASVFSTVLFLKGERRSAKVEPKTGAWSLDHVTSSGFAPHARTPCLPAQNLQQKRLCLHMTA